LVVNIVVTCILAGGGGSVAAIDCLCCSSLITGWVEDWLDMHELQD